MLGAGDSHRSVLSEAVVPPPGYAFDEGVVTTYSLDLPTLLTLPVHLVLADPSSRSRLLENPVALLDAVRRARDRITVFCEQGRMLVPRNHHVLFSLLEPVIHEVLAPRGGSFHPKLWVLKFRPFEGGGPRLMRLLVLSRNLTDDRSWDLALRLDGQLVTRGQPNSAPLRWFLHWFEGRPGLPRADVQRMHRLALEVGRTQWDVPAPFQEVSFSVLGLDARGWMPKWDRRADQLVVISPFVKEAALVALADTARNLPKPAPEEETTEPASKKKMGPIGLVSRPEQLEKISPAVLKRFGQIYVLKEHVESEDGEDLDPALGAMHGLHAKAYLSWKGWRMRASVGSANATVRALIRGENVEILAELEGLASHWGRAEDFLEGENGIGDLLEPWVIPEEAAQEDEEDHAAKAALEQAACRLARAELQARCESLPEGLVLEIAPRGAVDLEGVDELRVWPVTLSDDRAQDGMQLAQGLPVRLGIEAAALVTGLVAFELKENTTGHRERFVRNLPVQGLPEDRDGAIIEAILQGKDGFLNYLRYLLGVMGSEDASGHLDGDGDGAWNLGVAGLESRCAT